MFNTLQNDSATRRTWWVSIGLHGLVVTLLVAIPLLFPESLNMRFALEKYNVTALISPPIPRPPKAPSLQLPAPKPERRKAPVPSALALREPVLPTPSAPTMEVRKTSTPPLEPVKLEAALLPPPKPVAPPPPPPPPREIVTGVLAGKNPDTVPVNKPAREIQTGGFGDPNGIRGEGRPSPALTVASLGSFDLPVGAGNGNGTGGARGSQGVVASAGFGNAVAGNSSRTGSNATIQQGSFGDARPDQTGTSRSARPAGPSETAAEVTFKPRPEYTEEARQARYEGEVLVRVVFAATGDIRVLELVKGLPHGLNENALRAAQQIRFKPATKDGRPVDSVAVVRINFQLAY